MPKVLTEAAGAQYERDGYCAPFGLLEPEEAAAMRGALERLEAERGGPRKDAFRIKGHLLLRWMTDLVRNPRLLDAVEDLIGPDILCWTSQWWIKEPHSPQFVSFCNGVFAVKRDSSSAPTKVAERVGASPGPSPAHLLQAFLQLSSACCPGA